MACSLEVREPFMDYRLIEFVLSLPNELKIDEGLSKFILRQAIPSLPDEIKYRGHKMGFVAPDRLWLKKNKEK
jgi:asparagine synthase (glutamine-hydrolysing)